MGSVPGTCRSIKIAPSPLGTGEPAEGFEPERKAVRFVSKSMEAGLCVCCGRWSTSTQLEILVNYVTSEKVSDERMSE